MQFGVIKGTVVSTQKVQELTGVALKVLVPTNSKGEPISEPIVATDPIGAREGDLVLWVGKREASLAMPGAGVSNMLPVDAAITGIVDAVG